MGGQLDSELTHAAQAVRCVLLERAAEELHSFKHGNGLHQTCKGYGVGRWPIGLSIKPAATCCSCGQLTALALRPQQA